ncbi:MAG: hypothetical protein KatS3mg126_1252 [Lysobacteraceae bacterium]|nr:MAG: hypothetical protein KatS3mg126_1252 [Xanthomonadaceae bacterium]
MSRGRLAALLVLAGLAAVTSWLVWQLRADEGPPELVGPPRSDYQLEDYELIAFDEQGAESFWVRGPRLARHPELGTLELEQPRLGMPAPPRQWRSRADRGWVSADADRIRLLGAVELQDEAAPAGTRVRMTTEALDLLPRENRAETGHAVTIEGPGSILRGRGLLADLSQRRVQLLSEVTGRHEPARR